MSYKFFERAAPESCGVKAGDISDLIDALCDHPAGQETHSFMLLRHGKVLSEGYFAPYSPDMPHTVYSITKAFTGMAVGFLASEGKLSVGDRISEYFPEYEIHPTLEDLTIDHLLMMGTGQVGSAVVHDVSPGLSHDIAGFFMTPSDIPHGSEFRYQNRVSYVLAALCERLSGMSLMDYLDKKLFSPMGMERPYAVKDPSGQYLGYSGMRLAPEQLAGHMAHALGLGGVVDDRRIAGDDGHFGFKAQGLSHRLHQLGEAFARSQSRLGRERADDAVEAR